MIQMTTNVLDRVSPDLRRRLVALKGTGYLKAAARGVATRLRDHFGNLNTTEPNKLGGKRTNFWSQVRRSVQNPKVDGRTATIAVNHEAILQKIRGGVIRPGPGKTFLTIPVNPRAYGRKAREFGTLRVERNEEGAFLVLHSEDNWGNRDERGRFLRKGDNSVITLYRLVRKVKQDPKPDSVPTDSEIHAAADRALQDYLAALEAQATR